MRALVNVIVCAFLFNCATKTTEGEETSVVVRETPEAQNPSTPAPTETAQTPGTYPAFSTRPVVAGDLDGMALNEIRIARNEIFARYGHIFKSEDLIKHFSNQSWYKPEFANVDDMLTDVEKENVAAMVAVEKEFSTYKSTVRMIKRLPYLQLPFYFNNKTRGGMIVPPGKPSPDGSESPESESPDYERMIYGLLPDTSEVYAVVWNPRACINECWECNVLLTMVDKKTLTPTGSYGICIQVSLGETYADCEIQGHISSTIYESWEYYSLFDAYIFCGKEPDRSKQPEKREDWVKGEIGSDGSVTSAEGKGLSKQGSTETN